MEPSARPIRTEFREATVVAIRQRGPEAVGLLLIGLARLLLAVGVLIVLHFTGATMFGFSLMSTPFAAVSVLSIVLSFLATHGYEWGGESEAPTHEEHHLAVPEPFEEAGAYARLKKMFTRVEPDHFEQPVEERERGEGAESERLGDQPRAARDRRYRFR